MEIFSLLNELPAEILLVLAQHLPPRDITSLACCSHKFAEIFLDHHFWKYRFLDRWTRGSAEASLSDLSWVDRFRLRHRREERFKRSTHRVSHHRFSNHWVGGLHDHSGLLVALQSHDDYGSILHWHLSAIGVSDGQLNITRISPFFFSLHRTLRPIAGVSGRYCVAVTKGRAEIGENTTVDVDETVYIIDTKRAKLRRTFPLESDFVGSELVVCRKFRCFAYVGTDKQKRKHVVCRSLRDGSVKWRFHLEQFQSTPRIALRAGSEHVIILCAEIADGVIILEAERGTMYWRPRLKEPLHQCLQCEFALGGTQAVLYSFTEPQGLTTLDLKLKSLTPYVDVLPAIYPPSLSACENRLFVAQDSILTVLDLTNGLSRLLHIPNIDSGDARAPYRISASSSFVILERHGSISCVSNSAQEAKSLISVAS